VKTGAEGHPQKSAQGCWNLFADAGGNVIDTADVDTNGTSETASCSKGAATGSCSPPSFTNQTDPGDPNSVGNHRKKIVTSIEASLGRLQTDHIDLYWVHARDVLTSVEELMRALDDQVRLGKVSTLQCRTGRHGRTSKAGLRTATAVINHG